MVSDRFRTHRQLRAGRGSSAALICAALALLVPAAIAAAQSGSSPKTAYPMRFIPGAITAQVRGRIPKANMSIYYTLKAKSGQHMTVNLIAPERGFAVSGVVTAPSGKEDGGPGPGVVFDRALSETGSYVIRVSPNLMASQRQTGPFMVEVIVR
jgi:hypothetical protein